MTQDDKAVDGTMVNAFISYASQDRDKAVEVCDGLEERGLACWIAPRNVRAGAEYGEEIARGIRESRCLVLLLSDACNASPMVRREVERAVSLGKPVFPIRVEEVLPARSLEFFVSSTHWIDAWDGDLAMHIRRLADELADERALDEALGAITTKRRKRTVTRATWTTGAALVIAVLSVILASRGAANAGPDRDPTRARFAEYGHDIDDIGPDDFNAEFVMRYGVSPNIRVLDSDLDRNMTAFAWLEGRVGDRPWSTLLSGDNDAQMLALDPIDLERGGMFQIRIIADSMHHPDEIIYGPYDLGLDVKTEYERALAEILEKRKAQAEQAGWLDGSIGWRLHHTFHNTIGPVISSIAFGTTPGSLDTVLEIPRESDPIMMYQTPVGESVDNSRLDDMFRSTVRAQFNDTPRLYTQFTYIDGTTSPVRAFAK